MLISLPSKICIGSRSAFFTLASYLSISWVFRRKEFDKHSFKELSSQDPVVQSIVSLTSSLVVEVLIVLVGIISKSQVVLLKKCE